MPYWPSSVADVAKRADDLYSRWNLVHLQYVFYERPIYRDWAKHLKPDIKPIKMPETGAVANLFSYRGLKDVVDKFYDHNSNKFACAAAGHAKRCVSDFILLNEINNVYSVSPPMFTVSLDEGGTGLRCKSRDCSHVTVNDHEHIHVDSFVHNLQWAVEGHTVDTKCMTPYRRTYDWIAAPIS